MEKLKDIIKQRLSIKVSADEVIEIAREIVNGLAITILFVIVDKTFGVNGDIALMIITTIIVLIYVYFFDEVKYFQYLASVLSITSFILITAGKNCGFFVSILGSICWLYYGIVTRQGGIFISTLFFLGAGIYGAYKYILGS